MWEVGRVVRSVAGHDKDQFYMIVSAAGDRVSIANGRERKLERPKVKNVRHVRGTNTVLNLQIVTTDKKLRQALQAFGADQEEGEV